MLVVLPQQDGPALTHALCWMVRTRTGGVNPGLWVSFVDAQSGALLNVHNQVRYATGTVYGTHVTRTVDGDFSTSTMPWMDLSSSAGSTTTDADGAWTLGGSSFTGVLSGDWVDVKNGSGAEGSLTWSSGMPTWTEANATQAEIDSFVWQNKIHAWGQTWAPELDISNQQITSTVNLNDVCNAYYDGNVNFYKKGGGCNNTGQIADVNYHEWGHGFHAYAANTWSVDGSIGEGSGDAVSFFNTGDSVVAPFFITDGSGIRDYKGMLEYARRQRTTMGNYIKGSYQQILAGNWNRDFGCQFELVQYKGEVPMWVDMAAGQLDVSIGSYQAFAKVRDKGLRLIGVTGRARSPREPEVPTMIEQGFSGPISRLEATIKMVAHSSVPAPILDFLGKAAVESNETARAKAMREAMGIPDLIVGRAEALRVWREDGPVWVREVQALNLPVD